MVVLRSWRSRVGVVVPAAAVLLVQQIFFPVPLGVVAQGAVLGLLKRGGCPGPILVYRANRVVNLAQASIGAPPATLAGGVVLFGAPSLAATGLLAIATAVVVLLGGTLILRLPLIRAAVLAVLITAATSAGLHLAHGLGWWGGLGVGLVTAVLSGIAIDAIVIQRFNRAPRPIVTVATIGLAQLFAVLGLLAPRLWHQVALDRPEG